MNRHLDRNTATPLYVQIRDILSNEIEEGTLPDGRALPSIRKLADEFGVCLVTMRQALSLLVGDGVVVKRAGRGTYVKKSAPAEDRQKRPFILFLTFDDKPEWEDFGSEIKKGVEHVLDWAGFGVRYGPVDRSRMEHFMEDNCEDASGVIVITGAYEPAVRDFITKSKVPAVLTSVDPEIVDRTYINDIVNVDAYGSMTSMINYLVGLGHRRIATIHGPLHSCQGDRRRQGYHDALTSHGIEVRPEYELAGHFGIEESKEAARRLLELDEPPTAIVCNNDYTALGALSQVRSMGMHVPDDVSIASFLDIGMSAHTNPSLTAMTIDRRKLGDTLAWLMLARLANPGKPFTVIDFGMQLQIRESCKEVCELRAAPRLG